MSKLAKVAIGCAVVAAVVGMAVFAGVVGLAWWGKGKVEQFTAGEERIEQARRKANASSFAPPADGLIQEARLQKFLEVRRGVYGVYAKHADQLEALSKGKQPDLSVLTKGFAFLSDFRLAHAEALASAGMSEDEYRYLVEQVYKSWWAVEVARSSGGSSASDVAEQAAEQAKGALEKAEGEGLPEPARRSLDDAAKELEQGAAEARRELSKLEVPKANLELFRKYEAEIKKYAMTGLEFLSL